MSNKCVRSPIFLSAAMLTFGSINMLVKKILYQTKTENLDGKLQKIEIPWACTLVMFLGEFLCLGFFYIFRTCIRRKLKKTGKYNNDFVREHFYNLEESNTEKLNVKEESEVPTQLNDEPLEGDVVENTELKKEDDIEKESETIETTHEVSKDIVEKPAEAPKNEIRFFEDTDIYLPPHGGMGWKLLPIVIALSLCDLFSTTLSGIGLKYVNVSVVQILRGFVIVFTMLFSWAFLKKKPSKWNGLGVGFALIGLVFVGISAVLSDKKKEHTIGETFLGLGLTLISQVFTATQFVLEYNMLSHSAKRISPIPPMYLVGLEGCVGAILSLGVATPIVNFIPGEDHGSYESFLNSWYMVGTCPQALGLVILYFISISFFNTCGFMVSKALSATTRSMIDALRTIAVWVIMLIICYSTNEAYGEYLTWYSIIQIFGFGVMILGTLTYSNIKKIGEKMTKNCCNPKIKPIDQQTEQKGLLEKQDQ